MSFAADLSIGSPKGSAGAQREGMELMKILVADDEENYRFFFQQSLQKAGYQVKTAINGLEAIRTLRNEPFDLALIDVKMAPMDGFELLKTIREEFPSLKTIMVSAYHSSATSHQSQQLGANCYLRKPVEVNELIETIKTL